jgi:hypothetical protein
MSNLIVKEKIIIPKIYVWVLIYLVGIGIALVITNYQRKIDFERFNTQIDEELQGNSAIADYVFYADKGELHDAYLSDFKILDRPTGAKELRTKNFTIAFKPSQSNESQSGYLKDYYTSQITRWNRLKDIKQYFESEPFSGFELYTIKRDGTDFIINKYWSGDMAYLVSDKQYYPGYSSEYYNSPDYYLPKFRPSINKCYEGAAEYLLKESKAQKLEGVGGKTYSFQFIKSKFYHLEQNFPKYINFLDSVFVQFEKEGKYNPTIQSENITKRTSANDGLIYDSYSKVWYKSITNGYRIEEIENAFTKRFMINLIVISLFISLIRLILVYRNRISFK